MAVVTRPSGLPLWSDPLRSVWSHRVLICALGMIGLVAGYGWSMTQPTTYAATSSVVLTPVPKYVLPTGVGVAPPEVSIDTDAQLLNSPIVLDRVANALDSRSGSAMEHLSVTASANSRVLHVTATADSPEQAAAAANAAVDGLTRVRRRTLGSLRLDQVRLLRLWTTDQEDLLSEAKGVGAVIPAADDLFTQVVELRTALTELEEARVTPVQVINPAKPPRQPVRSNIEVPLVSGAMLAALIGCLIGVALDRRSTSLPTPGGSDALLQLLTFRPTAFHTTGI